MSEKYQKHSRSQSKSDKNKSTKRSRCYTSDSTTPPLPTRKRSIEDLMRQRQSIREELKNITSSKSTGDLKVKENKKLKNEKTHNKDENNKRHVPNKVSMDTNHSNNSSPEYTKDYLQLDSDDEENIIKQRRLQRKQLLDKLGKTDENIDNSNEMKSDSSQEETNPIRDQQNIILKCKSINEKLVTDMFSEEDFALNNSDSVTQDNSKYNSELKDNWDDDKGYYNIRTGDIINNSKYTIQTLKGQGVFSNVVKALDNSKSNEEVAIKILRNNELIHKTGLKELKILKDINDADPEDKSHCVRFLNHFLHRGHLCLVLEYLHMNLRDVIQHYGHGRGINMKAIMSYSRQLLLALRFLKKVGIIHADIKPDNIMVNEKKNVIKLCDFGSASKINESEPTPYLVSRFYRAPEIILGIPYKNSVDVWSTACTIYEIATGKILFTGSSNNKMLKCFMDLKGKIPSRIIKKGIFKDQHFNYNNDYLLHKIDDVTGNEMIIEMSNIISTRDLYKDLKKGYKNASNYKETKIIQLKELLEKMLTLDLNLRPSATDCLKHSFIQDTIKK